MGSLSSDSTEATFSKSSCSFPNVLQIRHFFKGLKIPLYQERSGNGKSVFKIFFSNNE